MQGLHLRSFHWRKAIHLECIQLLELYWLSKQSLFEQILQQLELSHCMRKLELIQGNLGTR